PALSRAVVEGYPTGGKQRELRPDGPPKAAVPPCDSPIAACQSRLFWGAMARLDERLDRGFDPRTAEVLAGALDLRTVGDLVPPYPRRYEKHGELTDMASLRDGEQVTG